MNRYQGLLQERANLTTEASAAFALAEAESRGLTEPERQRDDAIQASLGSLADELQRIERQRERERALSPGTPDFARITGVRDLAVDRPWGREGEPVFGYLLQAVAAAALGRGIDPRLYQAAAQGAGEAIPADGGYLVGFDMLTNINLRLRSGDLLNRVRRIPIGPSANGVTIKVVDETSRATGSRHGAVRGYYVDEGTAPTASRPKFNKVELKLIKVAALGYASDELLADAAALQGVMTEAFADELKFLTEDAIINGDGSGKCLGVLNAACLVSVAKETGQAATTIVKANIDKMWSRMYAPSRRNAIWFINQDIEPQLESLAADVGTGGIPVYLPPGGIVDAPNARLKGRPVIPIEYCATLGTVGDIILADMEQYWFIDKGGVQQATSLHVAFTTDEMAFRATYRHDGQPWWRTVLTPFKGTANTLSPFVALATRA